MFSRIEVAPRSFDNCLKHANCSPPPAPTDRRRLVVLLASAQSICLATASCLCDSADWPAGGGSWLCVTQRCIPHITTIDEILELKVGISCSLP